MTADERVVLLADDGTALGAAPKADVHHRDTALHLAFSCYVLDADGRMLLTRRALTKTTWPGTWTNAFCGHPEPFEPIPDAVHRRASHELGLTLGPLRLVLPDFRYRAVDASGIVENEICPVYVATATSTPVLNPEEAMDAHWADPPMVRRAVAAAPWAFSPWMVEQIAQMVALDEGAVIPWHAAAAR